MSDPATSGSSAGGTPCVEAADQYFVTSVARGLRVLSEIDPAQPELTQKQIAAIAGVSGPSALRIGHTLLKMGFLTRNPVTKGYRLGPQALSVGLAGIAGMPLLHVAQPFLSALLDECGETVKLAVRFDHEVVYAAKLTADGYRSHRVEVGTKLGVAHTSMGRALLSHLPREHAHQLLVVAQRESAGVVVDVDAEMAVIEGGRRRGYYLNDQSRVIEYRSIASPVVNARGVPVAAVNISVFAQRLSAAQLERQFAGPIVRTAELISASVQDHPDGAQ